MPDAKDPDRHHATPAWVKAFGWAVVFAMVVFIVAHLTGHGLHDHVGHASGTEHGAP